MEKDLIRLTYDADEIWPLIEKVVGWHGGYWKEDIQKAIDALEMQCHIFGDLQIGIVTQIIDYPRQRVLLLLFGGGRDFGEWADTVKEYFTLYARSNGCSEIQMLGRFGWKKYYPALKTSWCVYRSKV